MIQKNYEMDVLVNGKPVKEYLFDHRVFIEGRKNSVFTLRLRNNTAERVLFVPSVDGLSVMDGKDSSYNSGGYLVGSYSSIVVDGWRLSDDDVAEFYFTEPGKSYRKRQKKGGNLGSIAVAVFKEKRHVQIIERINYIPYIPYKPWPIPQNPFWSGLQSTSQNENEPHNMYALSASCSLSNCKSEVSQEVGTGFGDTKRSEVTSVSFEREDVPDDILEIFYNSREQLVNLGVDVNLQKIVVTRPNSFPGESGYCQRPKN